MKMRLVLIFMLLSTPAIADGLPKGSIILVTSDACPNGFTELYDMTGKKVTVPIINVPTGVLYCVKD